MINYPNGRKYNPSVFSDFEELQKKKGNKKSKYNAKKEVVDGITFDSKKEAKRYLELKAMEKVGAIQKLQLQVPFVLIEKSKYGRSIKYVADFVYNKNGSKIVEDVKGVKTPVYKLKKRLMAEKYGIMIQEV